MTMEEEEVKPIFPFKLIIIRKEKKGNNYVSEKMGCGGKGRLGFHIYRDG